jgi:chemotaxis protein CheY-P-specific phosphatase CheC
MLALSGCVNLEFPGLIADTAKISKDAYTSVVGKKEAPEPAKPTAVQGEYIAHAYIGQESQTVTEIKQLCVNEAAEKLSKLAGKDVRYSVTENTITTVNNTVVANCKLTIEKQADSAVPYQ